VPVQTALCLAADRAGEAAAAHGAARQRPGWRGRRQRRWGRRGRRGGAQRVLNFLSALISVPRYHKDIQVLMDQNITKTRSRVMYDVQGAFSRVDIKQDIFVL